MKTVAVGNPEPGRARWPGHLPVGALQVVRWSAHYDQTVIFYRDTIGLPVLETFCDSYGPDGVILVCPAARSTWKSSGRRTRQTWRMDLISWCSACPMPLPRSASWHGWPPRARTRLRRSITGRTTAASPIRTRTGGR
jgi:hypothetical protein